MTNNQKKHLRWIMRNEERNRHDLDIAEDVGCTIATVKKYRNAITPNKSRSEA